MLEPRRRRAIATVLLRHEPCGRRLAAVGGRVAMFVRAVLPMLRPAIVVVVSFNFVPLWNEFFFPLILLRSPEKFPVAVGLTNLFGKKTVELGPLFAGLILVSTLLVGLFFVVTRRVVDSFTSEMFK